MPSGTNISHEFHDDIIFFMKMKIEKLYLRLTNFLSIHGSKREEKFKKQSRTTNLLYS